ncbi:MAG: ATP-binding cassette domain-containing protein [Oligoflexia bacterium]|nr:ATP-binding cassette domain-containing protein [Oligoflexia bacterium]
MSKESKLHWYSISGLTDIPHISFSLFDLWIATLVINILSLAMPITLMQVYDRIITYNAKETLFWLVSGCITAILLETLIRLIRSYTGNWLAARFGHLASDAMIKKILCGRIDKLEAIGAAEHLDRLNAVGILRSFYSGQLFQAILDVPFIIIFIYAFWYLSPPLAQITIAAGSLFVLLVLIIKLRFKSIRRQQLDAENQKFERMIEFLERIHTIKSMNLEEQILRKFENIQDRVGSKLISYNFYESLPTNLGAAFSQLLLFSIIWVGADAVIQGTLTIGALTACTMLSGRVMQPLQNFCSFLMKIADVQLAISKIDSLKELPVDIHLHHPPFPRDISGQVILENVTFAYDGQDPLLREIDLRINPGETIMLLSTPGAGITTLLQLIRGALLPNQGRVLIDEYDLSNFNLSNLKGVIEYSPSKGVLFKGTVLENITLFHPDLEIVAMDAAALLGIDKFIGELPKGYETKLESQSNNLFPKGIIQRIALARCLVYRPRILLFDRTDHYMDIESFVYLRSLLSKLKNQCTMVLATRNPALFSLANRILTIKDQKLQEGKWNTDLY